MGIAPGADGADNLARDEIHHHDAVVFRICHEGVLALAVSHDMGRMLTGRDRSERAGAEPVRIQDEQKALRTVRSVTALAMAGVVRLMALVLVAMLFVVFDVEIIFLFAWASIFEKLGWYGIAAVFIFTLFVLETLAYVWKRGALDWNVHRRARYLVDEHTEEAA